MDRVLKIIGLDPKNEKVKIHYCPAHRIFNKDPNGKPHKKRKYRSAVGFLSYTQDMTKPDIIMVVQQCTIF